MSWPIILNSVNREKCYSARVLSYFTKSNRRIATASGRSSVWLSLIATLNLVESCLRQGGIQTPDSIRHRDAVLRDDVKKREEVLNHIRLVHVDLTWVNSVVSSNSHNIERLLNSLWKTFLYELANIVVDIVPGFTEFPAQMLNGESKQSGRTSWRLR